MNLLHGWIAKAIEIANPCVSIVYQRGGGSRQDCFRLGLFSLCIVDGCLPNSRCEVQGARFSVRASRCKVEDVGV
jgi:hypothetical protein